MVLFNFFIFNRYAECISYIEWHRDSPIPNEEAKVVAGGVSTLLMLVQAMSPRGDAADFKSFRTSHYRLHYLETMTGFRFCLLTQPDASAEEYHKLLKDWYATIFLDLVVRDAKYSHAQGVMIQSSSFVNATQDYFRRHT